PNGKRMHPDERFVIRIEHRPFSRYAIDWIWPVQYNDWNAAFLASTQGELQRPHKRVVTRPDGLKIDQEEIQAFQHYWRRLAMMAVKAVDGDLQTWMLVTFPFHRVVLRLAEKSMLRAKKRGEVKQIATMSLQDSRRVFKL